MKSLTPIQSSTGDDSSDDIISISTTGDTSPNRRFAYHFAWEK